LEGRQYLVGEQYSIADIATFPWIKALDFYQGKEHLGYSSFSNIQPWLDRCIARPAVQTGLQVCSFDS